MAAERLVIVDGRRNREHIGVITLEGGFEIAGRCHQVDLVVKAAPRRSVVGGGGIDADPIFVRESGPADGVPRQRGGRSARFLDRRPPYRGSDEDRRPAAAQGGGGSSAEDGAEPAIRRPRPAGRCVACRR